MAVAVVSTFLVWCDDIYCPDNPVMHFSERVKAFKNHKV